MSPLDCLNDAPPAPFLLWLTTAWTATGTALYLLIPASAPLLLPLCLVLPLTWHWYARGHLKPAIFSPVAIALAVGACYALINASWSPARAEAYQFGAMLLVIALCAPITVGTMLRIGHYPVLQAMTVGFYGAFAAVGAFLCFEIFSEAGVHTVLVRAIPALWPNTSHDVARAGGLPDYFLNKKMAGLAILFWPAVLAATRISFDRASRLLLCGLAPAVIAIAGSEHQTSKIALLVSGFVYVAFKMAARTGHGIVLVCWTVACFAVVPLCLHAYAADMHHARWLQTSAQHRIVIWKATSDRVVEAPLLGSGLHASRVISRREPAPPLAPGTPYRLSVSWHSHNAFLQVWFETGAVGAVILWTFGVLVVSSIRRSPLPEQAALFATFSSCAMLAATGYSAFAPWLSASFALAAAFISPAVALASAHRRTAC